MSEEDIRVRATAVEAETKAMAADAVNAVGAAVGDGVVGAGAVGAAVSDAVVGAGAGVAEAATETDQDNPNIYQIRVPKFKYKAVETAMDETYNFKEVNNSTICDIIAMYLKGQKIIYTEAKTVCEQRLNALMLPAIFITALCTILSLVLKDFTYGPTIVSSLNGINAFLLALINYLKLDAKAEAHRTSAYKFDKLQSFLEFNSGKILFLTGENVEDLKKVIADAESTVNEIKSTNQFILPAYIRYNFPRLTNINVFAEVKKIMTTEMMLLTRLKDVMNEHYNYEQDLVGREITEGERDRVERLTQLRSSLTYAVLRLKDEYLNIDDQFEEEINAHRQKMGRGCQICGWLKS
jgi:hypothetical protein